MVILAAGLANIGTAVAVLALGPVIIVLLLGCIATKRNKESETRS